MNNKIIKTKICVYALILFGLMAFAQFAFVAAHPSGADVQSVVNSSSMTAANADSNEAIAGNVTELILYGKSNTQAWTGYYGNVSGVIQLGDGSDNIMYNWTLANPRGEVYASTNSSVEWTYLQCFNFTADGTHGVDTAQAGATSLHGLNLSTLEARYNINISDIDGVNETFGTSNQHRQFYTAGLSFGAGECKSASTYNSTKVLGDFQEALMYEPTTTSVVFASLLEQDKPGFDARAHDFQMLVLEDGHMEDTLTTSYYFFVELQ